MSNTRALTISVLHLCVQGLFVACGTGETNDAGAVDSGAPAQRDDDESNDSDEPPGGGDDTADASTTAPLDGGTSTPDARVEGTDASSEPAVPHAFAPIDGPSNHDLVAAWVSEDDTAYVAEYTRVHRYDGATFSPAGAAPSGGSENPAFLSSLWGDAQGTLYAGAKGYVFALVGDSWTMATHLEDSACVGEVGVFGLSSGSVFGACPYYQGLVRFTGVEASGRELLLLAASAGYAFSETDVFVMSGQEGKVYRYRGGEFADRDSWKLSRDPGSALGPWLRDLWSPDGRELYAVGDDGTIAHFDGQTWSDESSGTTFALYGVWGSPRDGVFAVGEGGLVLHKRSEAWAPMDSGTFTTLRAVRGHAGGTIMAVGDGGTVITAVR